MPPRVLSLPRGGVLQQRWTAPLGVMYEPYQVAWIDDGHIAINFFVRRFERANHWPTTERSSASTAR